MANVDIQFVNHDILTFNADVLAFKYAQANYGVDLAVSELLLDEGHSPAKIRPKPGEYSLLRSAQSVRAKMILFVGVVPLNRFGYRQIRDFSRRCLTALAGEAPNIKTLALTLHGAGYGLDESESFEAELAGIFDAASTKDFPSELETIFFVERKPGRCERLQSLLNNFRPESSTYETLVSYLKSEPEKTERLRAAGYASDSKPHVFVAMSFKDDMDDVYHYGIQGAVNKAGFLCERADLNAFTGDVMQWVRERIRSSSIVIADLSDSNPNVYLEVGYAWGCGTPTVLLAKDTSQLKFDVRGQRCILYKKIKDLEKSLTADLTKLRENGNI